MRNIEHEIELFALENINQRNHDLNQKLTLYTNLDKTRIEQEIANNQEAMKIISDAHLDLTKEMVNDWLEKEKSKIRDKSNV